MKTEVVQLLTQSFEDRANKTSEGVDYWFARDLQTLLGYGKWENFQNVLAKAQTACEGAGVRFSCANIDSHFDLG